MKKHVQRGAALLMAMLVVVLVATFAAASLWQQWRTVEVETAERARIQSGWILTGALDWARLLLREDFLASRNQPVDHLGEPWAVPLQEARLSSFLAADNNNTTTDLGPEVMEAFLSGQIVDMQSTMNLNNMVVNGSIDKPQFEAFERLFEILSLPHTELVKLAENLRFSVAAGMITQSPTQAPLPPRRASELVWLGVSPQTVAVLEPYVTLLPAITKVNVNTASAEVIAAYGDLDLSEAQRLVQVRNSSYFRNIQDIQSHLAGGAPAMPQGQPNELGVSSDFFEVRSRLRLDKLSVEERSVLRRAGDKVLVLTRERGTGDPTALSRIAMSQR
ncbi:MAG TPA: type II secretion system minor pseudopilin GspK [Ramlibacter sp.]|nr:type II secretion system minor pseudopilin GspK [Ramlibacter sp.]